MGDNGNIAPVNLGCRVKQRTNGILEFLLYS